MIKRMGIIGGLGTIVGFLAVSAYYVMSAAVDLAFGIPDSKNLIANSIEKHLKD